MALNISRETVGINLPLAHTNNEKPVFSFQDLELRNRCSGRVGRHELNAQTPRINFSENGSRGTSARDDGDILD